LSTELAGIGELDSRLSGGKGEKARGRFLDIGGTGVREKDHIQGCGCKTTMMNGNTESTGELGGD